MRKEQFFIGNVNICTKYEIKDLIKNVRGGSISGLASRIIESKTYRKNIPLLKLNDGNYVCVDSIDSLKKYIELYDYIISKNSYNHDIILSSCPLQEREIFVDEKSLVPYYDKKDCKQKTSIRKVQNDLLLDPRIPRGIDLEEDGYKSYPITKIKRYDYK